MENEIGMYAICAESENSFTYWIAGVYRGTEVPEGLELFTFPAGFWAEFSAKGPIPGALQSLNTAIRQEWMPNEGRRYGADGTATPEVYSGGDPRSPDYTCGIRIPVARDSL